MTSVGQRIKIAREAAGLSQQDLAGLVGITQQTLAKLEKDPGRGTKHINKLARALGQDPLWLEDGVGEMRDGRALSQLPVSAPINSRGTELGMEMRPIRVVGAVQAGVWLPSVEWPIGDQFEMPLPVQIGYRGFPIQGLMVRGPSMDEVYPHGSILICVKFLDLGREPRSGERVVAIRLHHGECEATVKEFRIDRDGKARLWPRSSHPDFQAPIGLGEPSAESDELQVAFLVIGSYRPEM
jgi:repressor LexA